MALKGGARASDIYGVGSPAPPSTRPSAVLEPPAATPAAAPLAGDLDRLLGGGGLCSHFQPVVELESGRVVAHEALARGPRESPLANPSRLIAVAREQGRLAEVDWACRAAAWRSAQAAGLPAGSTLLVNVEPETLGAPMPSWGPALADEMGANYRIFVEITERALTARPAQLLRSVDRIRARGWGVALDDVGADRRSLALMPLLRPDLIKLDLRLVQERPTPEIAEIVNAVNAESERSGAAVLAEGIETEDHLALARALGARLGQGWLFGRPAARPAAQTGTRGVPVLGAARWSTVSACGTPCEIVERSKTLRRATKPLLHAFSRHLENQALGLGRQAVLLGSFEHARFFSGHSARFYERLARGAALVAALGEGIEPEPVPGVRGGNLDPDDPVRHEWNVVVVGPHFAAALVARDLGDAGADRERRFDFAVTYERGVVVEAARALAARTRPVAQS